ncbi:MAG: NAD(+) synthase [Eggerthellaceae bacterium]|jgi:NAD+ synthetase
MEAKEQYETCVRALAHFGHDHGFSDFVIGLSGGMDSTLACVMAVDAFGADHVHGVLMPGPYSSSSSIEDATALAKALGLETQTVSITPPYESFLNQFEDNTLNNLARENIQARCRMVVLMALSNTFGWMVINTGNKSESYMGYSTLYGDTCGAFAPLGGLYKTTVYELARWRNSQKTSPIPDRVFTKPPSAELSENQEDEKGLGIDYATLDAILIRLIEKGEDEACLVHAGFCPSDIHLVTNRIKAYSFKRQMEPPYPTEKFYADEVSS